MAFIISLKALLENYDCGCHYGRLQNKIKYLLKVLVSFNDIYRVKKEYYKTLNLS